MLYTAVELAKADAGDDDARRRVRLLTPLLKFRACRDARRVTGDAMEVRGGVGYIEEWSDARLLRDAHLGSIWEGTSNIVALDVLRAIRKEKALEAMELDLGRVAEFARGADEPHARQAATGLFYACAAALHEREGRPLLAKLVRRHRLEPRDPLAPVDDAFAEALLQ